MSLKRPPFYELTRTTGPQLKSSLFANSSWVNKILTSVILVGIMLNVVSEVEMILNVDFIYSRKDGSYGL